MIKKLILILFLTGCTYSCTEEIIIPSENGNGGKNENNPAEETYTEGIVNIFLQEPGISTRAGWEYDEYFPSGQIRSDDVKLERKLYNLSLFYFDSNMFLEFYSTNPNRLYDYGTTGIDNLDQSNRLTSIALGIGAIPLTTGAHYFYVICNLSDKQKEQVENYCKDKIGTLSKDQFEEMIFKGSIDALEDLDGIAQYISNEPDGSRRTRIILTNVTPPTPFYMADRTLTSPGGSYPPSNNITIEIGFAVAKVSMAYVPSGNTSGGHLEDVHYRLVNDPRQSYLLSHIFKEQFYTPYFENKTIENYDLYFNPKSAIDKNTEELEAYSNYDWRKAITSKDTPVKPFVYCVENSNKIPLQGNSTMLLVRAKYTPKAWLNADETTGDPSGDGTFWRILKDEENQEYLSGYYNEEPLVSGSNKAVEYKEGYCYYPIWLETDGQFMVTRNSYHKIVITDVVSAGAPDISSVITKEEPLQNGTPFTKSIAGGNHLPSVTNGIRWETNY